MTDDKAKSAPKRARPPGPPVTGTPIPTPPSASKPERGTVRRGRPAPAAAGLDPTSVAAAPTASPVETPATALASFAEVATAVPLPKRMPSDPGRTQRGPKPASAAGAKDRSVARTGRRSMNEPKTGLTPAEASVTVGDAGDGGGPTTVEPPAAANDSARDTASITPAVAAVLEDGTAQPTPEGEARTGAADRSSPGGPASAEPSASLSQPAAEVAEPFPEAPAEEQATPTGEAELGGAPRPGRPYDPTAAAQGLVELNAKLLDLWRSHTDATFGVWRATMTAGSLAEAIKVQTSGMRQVYEISAERWKDISETTNRMFGAFGTMKPNQTRRR